VEMMEESFELWDEIEKRSGKDLFHKTGIIVFGDKFKNESDNDQWSGISEFIKSLEANHISHQVMSAQEVNDKYPEQLQLPADCTCVYEEYAGILRASKAVNALQDLFIQYGGHLLDNHRVTGIVPAGQTVTVQTERGNFTSKIVILTTGAWTNKITETIGLTLPLKVTKAEVFYWKTTNPKAFSADNFPVFICKNKSSQSYGSPILEYPDLIKICPPSLTEIDPDARDSNPTCTSYKMMSQFIQAHFKNVIYDEPAIHELCIITHTPDAHPFIDRHPLYSNIIIGAGFSGHGFKLGPVVGKMISEMVLNHKPSYDMSHFKINRFNK
jgi:sarcosine oxidase/L-pipecolate oxidase